MADLSPLEERIEVLAQAGDRIALVALLNEQHPADIADVIAHAPLEQKKELFTCVADSLQPDVLAELENLEADSDVLAALSDQELSDLVEEMSPDDAADLVGDLDEERVEHILELMEEEERADIRRLLTYDEETAGGLMTPDVVSFRGSLTVSEARQALTDLDDEEEPFYYLFIVDADNRMYGIMALWDLVKIKDPNQILKEIVDSDVISVDVDMDQEEVANTMMRYDLTAVPVVDASGLLVGRITIDDIVDVIAEEASEDMMRMAGTDDSELSELAEHSAWGACRARLPWLLVTLFAGFIYGPIYKKIEVSFTEFLVVSMCAPIIMAISGNTGIQSATLLIRGMAIGKVDKRNSRRLLMRELMTGTIMGSICGLGLGLFAMAVMTFWVDTSSMQVPALFMGATVGFSLFAAMTLSAFLGALVPLLFERFRIDPAVASGPLVTAINDIFALVLYFVITLSMLRLWHVIG